MDLVELNGIGKKNSILLNRLGIYNVYDLVTYFPKRYDVISRTDMSNILDKSKVIVDGIVEGRPTITGTSNGLKKISFRISNKYSIYNVIVFNQVYLIKSLNIGDSVIILGKYDKYRNSIVAHEVRSGILSDVPSIEGVYGLTNGLNRNNLIKFIEIGIESINSIPDYIPNYLSNKYNFMSKFTSIREIHKPSNKLSYMKAVQRLKYEEFFLYLTKIRYMKYCNSKYISNVEKKKFDYNKVLDFISNLPFELTKDQLKTIEEIRDDLSSNKVMNRLIQGDVGSGKTIVSFVGILMNYLSGFQSAMMVPTEILAVQHYNSAVSLFKNTDMRIELLTSNLSKAKRNNILRKLENGEIDFIVGTQSLIQKDVIYKKLGLVICDEQHRFGVNQRNILKNKGVLPDIISMSATPIPRTYALTIYGDMDVSSIKTKPEGRIEVSTLVKEEKEIIDVLKMMKVEIDKGHQVYVVAPAIENDEDELDNVKRLDEKMSLAFGKVCKIASIYGSMENVEKAKVMDGFSRGDSKILISTTVIEVGVNVPNASMIVIFSANMFGLSTLHQLRGRVGRGNIKSYCVLLSKGSKERLEIMEKTNDGFLISEYDFKTRGEGDLFGVRQSGDARFKLADLKRDYELLVRVKKDVDEFFDKYLENDEYSYYKKYLEDK